MRCVIYQGGAEVKNSVPLFVFPTKAPGGGMSPARPSGLRWKLNLRGRRQMKKKLFSLVLALALCLGLTLPVSAVDSDPVAEWNSTNAVKTGLTMFSEKDPTAQRPWYETVYGLKDSAGNIVVPAKYFSLRSCTNRGKSSIMRE